MTPLIWVTIYFLIGIIAANAYQLPIGFAWLINAVLLAGVFIFRNSPRVFNCLCALLLVMCGLLSLFVARYEPENAVSKLMASGIVYCIQATVVGIEERDVDQFQLRCLVYSLQHNEINLKTNGFVYLKTSATDIQIGQRIQFNAKKCSGNKAIPTVCIPRADDIVIVNGGKKTLIWHIHQYRCKASLVFDQYVPGLASTVLKAMVLGICPPSNSILYQSMVASGTVHVLVVSGFNVGIVVGLLMLFLKTLPIGSVLRIVCSLIGIVLYAGLTGFSYPVMRATIMASVAPISLLMKRSVSVFHVYAVSLLAILVVCPGALFNIGFQLSFVSTFSLIVLSPKILKFFTKYVSARWMRWFFEIVSVTIAAWIATVGIIFLNFKRVSFIAIIANIIIVPLANFLTLSGFLLLGVSLISARCAHYIGIACQAATGLLAQLSLWFSGLPGAQISF